MSATTNRAWLSSSGSSPTPGGIPSHAAPETPGSISEGGELGYSLAHAYGSVFDNPDLITAVVIGDGEAETGPLAASWHSHNFLDPVHDGAVLPILHLNGFKIANPTILARMPEAQLEQLLRGYGHEPHFVTVADPDDTAAAHRDFAAVLDDCLTEIRDIQSARRGATTGGGAAGPRRNSRRRVSRRRRSALARDCAALAEGLDRAQGSRRAAGGRNVAQPPGAAVRGAHQPGAPGAAGGLARIVPARRTLRRRRAPPAGRRGERPRGRTPDERHPVRERRRAAAGPQAAEVRGPRRPGGAAGRRAGQRHDHAGVLAPRRDQPEPRDVPAVRPGRDGLQPAAGRLRGHGQGVAVPDRGRRRAPCPRRTGHGGPQRAPVPGLAGGVPADRPARRLQLLRGLHPHCRLDVQPARQVAQGAP